MNVDTRIQLFRLAPETADVLRRIEATLADPEHSHTREPLPAGISRNAAELLAEAVRMDGGRVVIVQMDAGMHHIYVHDPRLTARMRQGLYTRLLSLGLNHANAVKISDALRVQRGPEQAAAEAYVVAMRAASSLTD